jgi:transcriptional regulator with XRE-family HTH domain
MTTSDMIRELCEKQNISLAELSRRIGQTPQNFNKKLKRGTVAFEEMIAIAETLDVGYEQAFIFPDGGKIKISNE